MQIIMQNNAFKLKFWNVISSEIKLQSKKSLYYKSMRADNLILKNYLKNIQRILKPTSFFSLASNLPLL